MLTRSDLGIAALQAVEPDHVERLILVVSGHDNGGSHPLAFDFDHIAFGHAQCLERAARHANNALPAFFLPGRRDLQANGFLVYRGIGFGHVAVAP